MQIEIFFEHSFPCYFVIFLSRIGRRDIQKLVNTRLEDILDTGILPVAPHLSKSGPVAVKDEFSWVFA